MAASNFTACLGKVLKHEGGYVNHKSDPGGATNRGVTHRTYDAWRRSKGLKPRSVKLITDSEVASIYRRDYWNKVSGDDLPAGVDYATFDGGVNSGPSRGVKWLQQALGITRDGKAGPQTISKAKAGSHRQTVVSMCSARMGFLRGLGHWSTFGKGWSRRVAEVEASAVAMVLAASGTMPKPSIQSEMKAESSKAKETSGKQAAGAATSGGSGGASATQFDWTAMDSLTPWIVGGCAVALVVLALVLFHKSRVNKARAEAYAAAAKEQQP